MKGSHCYWFSNKIKKGSLILIVSRSTGMDMSLSFTPQTPTRQGETLTTGHLKIPVPLVRVKIYILTSCTFLYI